MTLEELLRVIERERPATLEASQIAKVQPQPWVLRAGSGKDARIRMPLAGMRYERQPGESTWHRVDGASDVDVLDDAAA